MALFNASLDDWLLSWNGGNSWRQNGITLFFTGELGSDLEPWRLFWLHLALCRSHSGESWARKSRDGIWQAASYPGTRSAYKSGTGNGPGLATGMPSGGQQLAGHGPATPPTFQPIGGGVGPLGREGCALGVRRWLSRHTARLSGLNPLSLKNVNKSSSYGSFYLFSRSLLFQYSRSL